MSRLHIITARACVCVFPYVWRDAAVTLWRHAECELRPLNSRGVEDGSAPGESELLIRTGAPSCELWWQTRERHLFRSIDARREVVCCQCRLDRVLRNCSNLKLASMNAGQMRFFLPSNINHPYTVQRLIWNTCNKLFFRGHIFPWWCQYAVNSMD